jgi:hypothetical protein
MKKALCNIVQELLTNQENRFVLEFLQGKHHNKKKPQSCENWLQIELAKRLSKRYRGGVSLEVSLEGHNYDIVLEKENKSSIYIQIKINGNRAGMEGDIKSMINVREGYLLFLIAMKDAPSKKYKTNLEQLLDKSAIKEMECRFKEQIRPLIISGCPSIAISCIGFGKNYL